MTEQKNPLTLRGVKAPIDFERKEGGAFPMMRRCTDSKAFSGKAVAENAITRTEMDKLRNDLVKKEAALRVQFDQIRKEHTSYVAEMELETLSKDRRIAELQKQIDDACNAIANKEQTITFQTELIKRKDEKMGEQTKEYTKTIARAVHDLKSPLTAIKSSADVLSECDLTGDAKTLLGIILAGSKDLADMVEDILLTNKLTHNAIVLDKKTYSLTEQIRDLVSQNIEHSKKIGKTIKFSSAGKTEIHADELKMKRAVGNLVSNALKYGKSAVEISLAETADEIVLKITDDGKGFDEEVRNKVFSDKEMTTTDLINGNGFGLTNAKRLIELHGGKISLAENNQKSTTFDIRFDKE